MYQETVTLTVSAEHRGRETEAVDNTGVDIGLESISPGLMRVHFNGQLDAPDEPTHVCITLGNGLTYYGPIAGGEANAEGGWLTFECDMIDPSQLG
ncbi:hypothetical protein A7D27_17645 [Pseudomonas sp. 1D4]|jgi:hypothetical protein|uniref:Uncharacterized protein n=1 Tax=Metapseudomonas otitidis TaxID=319939 RepID=A0A1I0UFW7_9GAMM|nr:MULTISPECIES: hypothetical protein [Pseudomonas]MDL5597194.1 hypothetical protein [Bacillus subtilis]KIV72900.1 hypothetical protein SZ55_1684 [Pseudomonas sp. FeS53a]MBO2926947.1 hypothetical protein [Pseudomonas otitidis]MCO7555702.1 hypothetical protein [Pseudomonas otitidis]MCP1616821.1 hypothetical protein [Pseudomonas otitidis]